MESACESSREKLCLVIQYVWDNYYHIGEERDLAFSIAMLLYAMRRYRNALDYFQHSLKLWGPDASTYYNMAMCRESLGQLGPALELIDQTLEMDAAFEPAEAMRATLLWELNAGNSAPSGSSALVHGSQA